MRLESETRGRATPVFWDEGQPALPGGRWPQDSETIAVDDRSQCLSDAERQQRADFTARAETLRNQFDDLDLTVDRKRRPIPIVAEARAEGGTKGRGVAFHVSRQSLIATVACGFFDGVLIGKFMNIELHDVTLSPPFTRLIRKHGGAVKLCNEPQRGRNASRKRGAVLDRLQEWPQQLGLKRPLDVICRRMIGDPAV